MGDLIKTSKEQIKTFEKVSLKVANQMIDTIEQLQNRVTELEELLVDSAKAADLHYQQRNHAVKAKEAAERERDGLASRVGRLREENDRLKSSYGDNWYDGFMAAREWHLNENTCDLSDLDGSDVISLSENAEQVKAKGESE